MTDFEDAAKTRHAPGIANELWHILQQNKKWWLVPIVLVLGILAVLLLFASTAAAPFIYTLF